MKDLIEKYLEDQESAWAPTTIKSERSRLNAIADQLEKPPQDVYKYLVSIGQAPYTIKTTFIRLADMEKWAGLRPLFQNYLAKHQNRFKHAYSREDLTMTYTEASKRIETLEEPYRSQARGLLQTGLRISESYTASGGVVKGKGGKIRKVYGKIESIAPKSTFARKLKAVGLKPHSLRKLMATRLVEKGASAADLCKVLGWSSIKTAYQYLESREESKLEAIVAACKEEGQDS